MRRRAAVQRNHVGVWEEDTIQRAFCERAEKKCVPLATPVPDEHARDRAILATG